MWHGFQLFAPHMPEANRAIEDIARYVRLQRPTQ
jgi:acetyl esterase/lipase